jgi:hypothetical protein
MKPTNKIHTFLLLLALSAVVLTTTWSGCKKDDDEGGPCFDETNPACENYDPCWNRREPVSAEFEVYSQIGDTIILEFDTLLFPTALLFRAIDENADSYFWQFGFDPQIFTGRETSLSFPCSAELANSSINITLVTERLKDTICTKAVFLRDTVVKTVVFVQFLESAILGRYEGYLEEDPAEVYEIEIQFTCQSCQCNKPDPWRLFNLTNHGCWQEGRFKAIFNNSGAISTLWGARESDGCTIPGEYDSMAGQDVLMHLYGQRDSIRIAFKRHLYISGTNEFKIDDAVFYGKRVY